MEYYETIFENGQHSIAAYESDEEALSAIAEHHSRALNGLAGGPAGNPAERIVKVLVYETHPVEYAVVVSAKDAAAAVSSETVGDMVNPMAAAAALRELTSPVVLSGPHESNYKQGEVRELEGWDS